MLTLLRGLRFNLLAVLAVALISVPETLQSQETRASVVGRVTDPSGAVIPDVLVEAVSLASNVRLSTKSNADGAYTIPFLLPGRYRITASATGFRTFVRDNVELRIADRVPIEIRMQMGDASEQITVSAGSTELESASASLGQVVGSNSITQIPVPHGVAYALMSLSPGVAFTGNPQYDRPYEGNHTIAYTMDGVRAQRSAVTLDGSPNTAVMHKWNVGLIMAGYTPPADVVQELKVQTLNVDASIGHTQGGVTSLTLKSGGNDFHGTAYWSGQNPALNANLFFANATGQAALDFYYNRWGASLTGPVILPKLYNGRNKTFIMYAYEGIHESRPRGGVFTVPTAAERAGDFSALLRLGSQYQIYDPATRQPAPNGRFAVQPLTGNIVPASRIDRIATNLLKQWPLPNAPGLADGTSNFNATNVAEILLYYSHVFRIDHYFSPKHRIFVRGNTFERTSPQETNYFNTAATGFFENWWQRALSLDDVYEINATSILNVRANFYRQTITRTPPAESIGFDVASLGFPASYLSQIPASQRAFPTVNIAGFSGTASPNWFTVPNQTASAEASLTLVRGKHVIKLGGDARLQRTFSYDNTGTTGTGQFDFNTAWTQGPFDNSPAAPIGPGLASMLLGLPTGGLVNRNTSVAEQSTVYSWFIQDDWRISPRLTLNLGLRYELESPLTERYNRAVRGYDFQTPSPLNNQVRANYALNPIPEIPASQFNVIGGLTFPGANGQPHALWNPDRNTVMPRVGFAFQLNSATVIRGGYGIFYGPLGVEREDVIQTGFSQTTQLVPSLDNGLTFVGTLSNPFPSGIRPAQGSANGLSTFLGQNISFLNPDSRAPRQQRWHIGVQRMLPRNTLFEIAYVGNHGSHLQTSNDYRSLPLQYMSHSPVRDQAVINSLTQAVANPFYTLLPGTGLAGQTVTRAYLIQSGNYPQFTGMTGESFLGYSWYHSLQTKAERRFAAGWTFTSAFTWSKNLQALGRLNGLYSPLAYTTSDQDRPFRFVTSAIWELPFGKGKKFLAHAPAAVNATLGGWQLDGTYTWQSGQALAWGNVLFNGDIHNIVLPADQRSANQWFNVNAGFNRVAAQQFSYNYRLFPATLNGVRSAALSNINISALKSDQIREHLRLEVRFEMINAFNTPQFDLPNMAPTSSAFGTVTAQIGYARRIQFGAKVIF